MLTPVEPSKRYPVGDADRSFRRNDRPDFRLKRRDDRPDYRYGSNQVAAVDQDQPDAGSSQHQKSSGPSWGNNLGGKKPWGDGKKSWEDKPRYTFEMMLDGPCSYQIGRAHV